MLFLCCTPVIRDVFEFLPVRFFLELTSYPDDIIRLSDEKGETT